MLIYLSHKLQQGAHFGELTLFSMLFPNISSHPIISQIYLFVYLFIYLFIHLFIYKFISFWDVTLHLTLFLSEIGKVFTEKARSSQ